MRARLACSNPHADNEACWSNPHADEAMKAHPHRSESHLKGVDQRIGSLRAKPQPRHAAIAPAIGNERF